MDSIYDYEYFQHLALRPHTSMSLALMSAATRVAHQRFKNNTSKVCSNDSTHFPSYQDTVMEDTTESLQDLVGPVDETWDEYVNKISLLQYPAEGSGFAQAMWNLMHGGYVDREIVEKYLQLLRLTGQDIEISSPRMLHEILDLNVDIEVTNRPLIIPFFYEYHWMFAIIYSDCIHWYDSAIDGPVPSTFASSARPVVDGWKGPLHNDSADAGVLMLIGIKLLLQRKPHMSQEAADNFVKDLRTRIFIELLCHNTRPTSTDLAKLNLDQAVKEGDLFSNLVPLDTTYTVAGEQLMASYPEHEIDATRSADPVTSSESTVTYLRSRTALPTTNRSILPPTNRHLASDVSSSLSEHAANTARRRRPQTRVTNAKTDRRVHKRVDDRKVILENLSYAIHFRRSALVSPNDDPFVLWILLRYSKTSRALHRRYQAVLFHNMAAEDERLVKVRSSSTKAGRSMKRDLYDWKFWKRISDIGEKHGLGPYVSLCAFANEWPGYRLTEDEQKPLIEEFESRLVNKSDMLRVWLQDARGLCEAILKGKTRISLFEIDKYDLKSESEITDNLYRSYVSLSEHAEE